MYIASELRRFETRVANHTPDKFICAAIIHGINGQIKFLPVPGKAGSCRALMPQFSFLLMQDE
ncbi:hypothetical protein CXP54_09975 [Escherichia albertii]|nr:hypothetical protein CXP54_09975 [Escherichia albertii]EAB1454995.1 hypothetical protein [Escherichia albertii]EEW7342751.1 hypothetical protein [Escherichia albertii]